MSLILGINLSDRIYLAADTRITKTDKSGKITYFEDNFLKIAPLSSTVAVAAAGNARMASFIINELKLTGVANEGIRKCREAVEGKVREIVDAYFTRNAFASTVLIFGGINKGAKKKIVMNRFMQAVQQYQKTGNSMNMKQAIYDGLMKKSGAPNPYPELNVSDSHVFAVKINQSSLDIQDVEWGEYIAYGDKMTKDDLPEHTFNELEVSERAGHPSHDKLWLTIFIKVTAENLARHTVGGSVVPFVISDGGIGVLLGGVGRQAVGSQNKEDYYSYVTIKDGRVFTKKSESELIELKRIQDFMANNGNAELFI